MQIRSSVLLGYKNNSSPLKTVNMPGFHRVKLPGARKIPEIVSERCVFLHMSMSI